MADFSKVSGWFKRPRGGKDKGPERPNRPALTALVVADTFEDGQPVAAMLRALGLDVGLSVGGEQALGSLQRARPDVVYVDCWESRLGGLALLQVASHYHSDLPGRVLARPPGGVGGGIARGLLGLGVREFVPASLTARWLAQAVQEVTGSELNPELVRALIGDAVTPMANPDQLEEGTEIAGRYRVDGWLGCGACATVHRVVDVERGLPLALKLRASYAAVGDAEERLRGEFQVGRLIEHSNVVHTYEHGTWDGRGFVTLELLEGESLSERLVKVGGALPVLREAVPLLVGATRGVAAVHEVGVVHRDVKPENLVIDEASGEVKLIDFGIAQPPGTPSEGPVEKILGTPNYVSPEQLRGETHGTSASDVYSLGVVFYETLTGRRPFRGRDIDSLLMRVATSLPTAPIKLNPAVPRGLSDLVMAMLSKQADQRPANCQEVLGRLAVDKLVGGLA